MPEWLAQLLTQVFEIAGFVGAAMVAAAVGLAVLLMFGVPISSRRRTTR